MKQAKYRVEAFIVPEGNNLRSESKAIESSDAKFTDNLNIDKIIKELINSEENESDCFNTKLEEEGVQNLRNSIICIESYKVNKDTLYGKKRNREIKEEICALYPLNSLESINSLPSIEEINENGEEKFTDLCYHGCKNGCSAIVPSPQEVSEEVFKENWLQKLESIKQKETMLQNKENLLQIREKELLRREKEVQSMERLLRDKIKQVDLHLKQRKHLQNTTKGTSVHENLTKLMMCANSKELYEKGFSKNESSTMNRIRRSSNTDSLCHNLCAKDCKNGDVARREEAPLERISACESYSSSNTSEERKPKCRSNLTKSAISKSSSSKYIACINNKPKRLSKMYYEDLDTTLSADVGDSSFVQTSQKFNPELYRKPLAFTRSFSERYIKRSNIKTDADLESENNVNSKEEFQCPNGIEQQRILKRVTANISASQDKNTKFQNYGLIDQNVNVPTEVHRFENDSQDEREHSYLNLEISGKYSKRKIDKGSKSRPVSWNSDTAEWMRKKRNAYNTTSKRLGTEDFENKENLMCNYKTDEPDKVLKKKDIKNKIFTIFR